MLNQTPAKASTRAPAAIRTSRSGERDGLATAGGRREAEIARRAVGGRVCYGAASGGHSWQGGRVIKIMVGLTAGAPTVARRGRVCGGRERTRQLAAHRCGRCLGAVPGALPSPALTVFRGAVSGRSRRQDAGLHLGAASGFVVVQTTLLFGKLVRPPPHQVTQHLSFFLAVVLFPHNGRCEIIGALAQTAIVHQRLAGFRILELYHDTSRRCSVQRAERNLSAAASSGNLASWSSTVSFSRFGQPGFDAPSGYEYENILFFLSIPWMAHLSSPVR